MNEIITSRLILRHLTLDDADQIFEYQSDKANFPYVNMPVYDSKDQAYTYVEKMLKGMEEGKWYIWGIEQDDVLIGTISLWNFNEAKTKAEFGFGLFPDHRKRGYMTEAIQACEAFAVQHGMKQVEAYTNRANPDSNQLLLKMNYRIVETVHEDGEEMNVYRKDL